MPDPPLDYLCHFIEKTILTPKLKQPTRGRWPGWPKRESGEREREPDKEDEEQEKERTWWGRWRARERKMREREPDEEDEEQERERGEIEVEVYVLIRSFGYFILYGYYVR